MITFTIAVFGCRIVTLDIERADDNPLNSDQAHELAEALLDAAKEIDTWAGPRDDPATVHQ
jgi:hypothetical protein